MKLSRQFDDVVAEARKRLGMSGDATPDHVERLVAALDEGVLDDLVEQIKPAGRQVLAPRKFADVRPYSDEEWCRRHGMKD